MRFEEKGGFWFPVGFRNLGAFLFFFCFFFSPLKPECVHQMDGLGWVCTRICVYADFVFSRCWNGKAV